MSPASPVQHEGAGGNLEVNDETESSALLSLDLWGTGSAYSKRALGQLQGRAGVS